MIILEDLWYGNIDPQKKSVRKGSRMEKILSLVVKNEDALRETLSDKQKELFEKFCDNQSELASLQEKEAFTEGFCIAVKMMVDVMNTMEIPSVDD